MARHVAVADRDARLLAAAAHPIRLDMLRELAAVGQVCGCGFRVLGTVTQPTVSHHLRILRDAGLVTCARDHAFLWYRLDSAGVARLEAVVGELLVPSPAPGAVRACCSAGGADDERPG
jgi:ArsR family transcriptional regulator